MPQRSACCLSPISRTEQDEIAAAATVRATAAADADVLAAEIAAFDIPQRRCPAMAVAAEGIRADTDTEKLAALRPASDADGTITAGNASPFSDGAAAVVLTTRG